MSSKHVADTCPRDHDAELPQLTDDPEIAPARVLARETKDECDDLSIERVGRDVLGRRVGPVSANELPVPPHQRCGRNEEGGPTLARQESRERRQHDTIGRGEPRSRHLTTEHRELVTKDRDLDVLVIWRRSDPNEVEQLSNEKEGHRTAHADDPGTFAASLVRAAFLRLHPTRPAASRSRRHCRSGLAGVHRRMIENAEYEVVARHGPRSRPRPQSLPRSS